MIYSSIFEPTLLYGCSLWAPLLGTQSGIKLARQAQRPVLLSITKAFYTSSTESLLILSDLLPLDIRISELATKRQMLYNARQIPFSDTTRKWLLNKRPDLCNLTWPHYQLIAGQFCHPPWDTAEVTTGHSLAIAQIKSTITKITLAFWSEEWVRSQRGNITRDFFPTPAVPKFISSGHLSRQVTQVLTGHSYLNSHMLRFGFATSAACQCSHNDESIRHYIFDCPLYMNARSNLRHSCSNLSWSPALHEFMKDGASWEALKTYIQSTKRLRKRP